VSAAHRELLGVAERQLALTDAGRWDELPAAMEEFGRRAAALPAVAPASAADCLRRAAELVASVEERLRAGRLTCARELAQLQRGRGAVRSYGGAALAPGSQVDGTA
jgi:hypothetical protein